MEKGGPACSCGNHGCWAAYCSGHAIEKTGRLLYEVNTCKELFDLFDREDVKKYIEEIRENNAHGFGNIINAYVPDLIVVMGSLGLRQFDKIIPSKEQIEKYTINKIPDIIPTKLDSPGLLGANVYGEKQLVL